MTPRSPATTCDHEARSRHLKQGASGDGPADRNSGGSAGAERLDAPAAPPGRRCRCARSPRSRRRARPSRAARTCQGACESARAAGAGSSSSKLVASIRRRRKLASTRPLGEHHAEYWLAPAASAATSLVNWPCRKASASGPATRKARRAARGRRATAASRAARKLPGGIAEPETATPSKLAPRASSKSVPGGHRRLGIAAGCGWAAPRAADRKNCAKIYS